MHEPMAILADCEDDAKFYTSPLTLEQFRALPAFDLNAAKAGRIFMHSGDRSRTTNIGPRGIAYKGCVEVSLAGHTIIVLWSGEPLAQTVEDFADFPDRYRMVPTSQKVTE